MTIHPSDLGNGHALPELRKTLPTIPELSTDPDARELAYAYASHATWLRHQWPALVETIEKLQRSDQAILDRLDVLVKRGDTKKMLTALRVTSVLAAVAVIAFVSTLAWAQYHGH